MFQKNVENLKKKILPPMTAKNPMFSPLRQLQPTADKVETPFVDSLKQKLHIIKSPQKEIDFETYAHNKIPKMNASEEPSRIPKPSIIISSPKSKYNKKNKKSNMLSLKNKDGGGCSKNQPSITSFLVRTPPSEKSKVETEITKEKDSSTHVLAKRKLDEKIFNLPSPSKLMKETKEKKSPTHVLAKRELEEKIFNLPSTKEPQTWKKETAKRKLDEKILDLPSPSKTTKKSEKSGSKCGKANEKKEKSSQAGSKNSRHTKVEVKTIKEEQEEDEPKTPNCKIENFIFDSPFLIEKSDDEEGYELVMDNLQKMVNELRSPVKNSTPLPKHSHLEDKSLLKFPDPGELTLCQGSGSFRAFTLIFSLLKFCSKLK